MERPIVTTDLDFARDTCADAAVYFSPLDPEDVLLGSRPVLLPTPLAQIHDGVTILVKDGTPERTARKGHPMPRKPTHPISPLYGLRVKQHLAILEPKERYNREGPCEGHGDQTPAAERAQSALGKAA